SDPATTMNTRVSGASTAGTSTALKSRPTNLLRLRAAPPRRVGIPTRAITQAVTQTPSADLRLTPVIQSP
ncbi:hypothetical protein, partial [Klebsiella pneumoniae]